VTDLTHAYLVTQGWYYARCKADGKYRWTPNANCLTWWNPDKEVAIAHTDKYKKEALSEDPRIRVLTLRPTSIYFASFTRANGGNMGSWTSPQSIPLSECVSTEGEIYPSVLWSAPAPGCSEQDFNDDKIPLETF